jgi:hypothetical protein
VWHLKFSLCLQSFSLLCNKHHAPNSPLSRHYHCRHTLSHVKIVPSF